MREVLFLNYDGPKHHREGNRQGNLSSSGDDEDLDADHTAMGTLNRTERWVERIVEIIRGDISLDQKVASKLAKDARLIVVAATKAKTLLASLHAYVGAREAALMRVLANPCFLEGL